MNKAVADNISMAVNYLTNPSASTTAEGTVKPVTKDRRFTKTQLAERKVWLGEHLTPGGASGQNKGKGGKEEKNVPKNNKTQQQPKGTKSKAKGKGKGKGEPSTAKGKGKSASGSKGGKDNKGKGKGAPKGKSKGKGKTGSPQKW